MHQVLIDLSSEEFQFLLDRYPHYFPNRRSAPYPTGKRRLLRPSGSHMATWIIKAWIRFEKEKMAREEKPVKREIDYSGEDH